MKRNPSDPAPQKKLGSPQGDRAVAETARALPLLLLPGTLCDAQVFVPLFAEMAGIATPRNETRESYCVDLTGATHMEALAQRVLADAPERFILVGFSLGGLLALAMVVPR